MRSDNSIVNNQNTPQIIIFSLQKITEIESVSSIIYNCVFKITNYWCISYLANSFYLKEIFFNKLFLFTFFLSTKDLKSFFTSLYSSKIRFKLSDQLDYILLKSHNIIKLEDRKNI